MIKIKIIILILLSCLSWDSFSIVSPDIEEMGKNLRESFPEIQTGRGIYEKLIHLLNILDKTSKMTGEELQRLARTYNWSKGKIESMSRNMLNHKFLAKNIIYYGIPEILYCTYILPQSKIYYYPILKEKSMAESVKKFFHIKLPQQLSKINLNKVKQNVLIEEDLSANIMYFITSLLESAVKNNHLKTWDDLLYSVNCIAGAMAFEGKKYSAKVDINLKMAVDGVLKSVTSPHFSCITLTNFVLYILRELGNLGVEFTDNSGNSAHSYIKSISQVLENQRIYIDPFIFSNKLSKARDKFIMDKKETQYLKLLYTVEVPGIAYAASKENFQGIIFKNKKLNNNCKAELTIVYDTSSKPLLFLKNPDPLCEGKMFYLRWKNPSSKKYQSKIFALLKSGAFLELRSIPTAQSTYFIDRVLLGDLSEDSHQWFDRFFRNFRQSKNNQIFPMSLDNYTDFASSSKGDFSEFYK